MNNSYSTELRKYSRNNFIICIFLFCIGYDIGFHQCGGTPTTDQPALYLLLFSFLLNALYFRNKINHLLAMTLISSLIFYTIFIIGGALGFVAYFVPDKSTIYETFFIGLQGGCY